jgi:hypothetical protein
MAEVQNGRLKSFFKKQEIQNLIFLSIFSLFLLLVKFFFDIPTYGLLLNSKKEEFDIIKEFIANNRSFIK